MRYKAHLFGGAVVYALVLGLFYGWGGSINLIETVIGGAFCLLGSIFPDIDTKSVMQKLFFRCLFLATVTLLIVYKNITWVVISLLIGMVPLLVPHRGLFHRWWFVIGLASVIGLGAAITHPMYIELVVVCTGAFCFGTLTHLLLDKKL